jgi:hypothetical protein
VLNFKPDALPTNPMPYRVMIHDGPPRDDGRKLLGRPQDIHWLEESMKVARAVMRGAGFADTSPMATIEPAEDQLAETMRGLTLAETGLPTRDLFKGKAEKEFEALMDFVLAEDRARFMAYFSHRYLGLALITAVCKLQY